MADEGQAVLIWTAHTGERLTFLPGWQRLPPPEGETLAAYLDRAIFGHPLVQDILSRGASMPGGLKLPRLDGARPAERTLAWWEKTYLPFRMFHWENEKRCQALEHYLKLIVWRLAVELFDRLKAGDLVAEGRRIDVPEGPESVPLGLWRNNPDMVFRPSLGVFRPEQRSGQPAPGALLPSYVELALMPVKAAKKKPKTKRELLADALISLHGKGEIDIHSRALSVEELHAKAMMEAKLKVSSKANFEKALKDAHERLAGA